MTKTKTINNVRFKSIVTVRLIPICKDTTLWWSQQEVFESRCASCREIVELLSRHKEMSQYDAKRLLYQPNNITYNINNFIQ